MWKLPRLRRRRASAVAAADLTPRLGGLQLAANLGFGERYLDGENASDNSGAKRVADQAEPFRRRENLRAPQLQPPF